MASADAMSPCSMKLCQQPSAGVSPRSRLCLCKKHLKDDSKKVQQMTVEVMRKIRQRLKHSVGIKEVRGFHGFLVAEIQEMNDTFDYASTAIDNLRELVIKSLEQKSEEVRIYAQHLSELEKFEKDLKKADDEGDVQREFELSTQAELLLDSTGESVKQLGGTKNLKNAVDKQSPKLLQSKKAGEKFKQLKAMNQYLSVVSMLEDQIQLEDSSSDSSSSDECSDRDSNESDTENEDTNTKENQKIIEHSMTISDLNAKPTWLAACTKTQGFFGDMSGRIIKKKHAKDDDETIDLPQTVVFVAFYFSDSGNHFLVTSIDGQVRLRYHSDQVDWKTRITGIHCDSNRQLLFVAQPQAVVVTHLCGSAYQLINAETIQHPIELLNGIDGDADKFFVFDLRAKKILCISKESGELETDISVDDIHGGGDRCCSIALLGSRILVTDPENGKVHAISRITKRIRMSYPNDFTDFHKFEEPISVVTSARDELIFVSNCEQHDVDVLFPLGVSIGTLGKTGAASDDRESFSQPYGLTVVAEGDRTLLIVSDSGNKRLQVWKVSTDFS